MKEKLEALTKFKDFKEKVKKEVGCKIQFLCTGNGGEYTSKEFTQFLQNHSIRRQLTCPYIPQQNEVTERKNWHLVETCRSMLHTKNISPQFLVECMKTVVYVTNRLSQARLGFISP